MSHLPKPGDPLIHDGKIIAKEQVVDTLKSGDRLTPIAYKIKPSSRRNMNDMPCVDANRQMALNVILVYSLLGLTDNEISHLSKIPVTEIENLRFSSDYQVTFEMLFKELISVNSTSIKARLSDYATRAVDNIIELAETADKDIVKLKANQDVLDRAGLSADTLFNDDNNTDDDTLKIVIDNGTGGQANTNININLKGRR